MNLQEILKIQREEKLYRNHPELAHPASLPEVILKEFSLSSTCKEAITFIIPFRGDDRLLQLHKCINNLVFRYPTCEILIIEEGLSRVIKRSIPGTRYMFVYSKRLFNKSKCFNIGFLAASNNIICGLDCDMIIPSTLIDLTLEKVNANKVVFPGNDIFYVYEKIDINNLKENIWYHKTWSKDRATSQFHGGIFICNKKTYATVGGFDQRFEGYGSEDSSFYLRCTDSIVNADTTRVINLLHIDHGYNEQLLQATETNRRLLITYSHVKVDDRILDCKNNNIFNKT
jgi:hypothetical protein